MKKGSLVGALLAGLFAGVVLTIIVGSFWGGWSRDNAWSGLRYGFGIGFGGVTAVIALNRFVGFLDRVASGKG